MGPKVLAAVGFQGRKKNQSIESAEKYGQFVVTDEAYVRADRHSMQFLEDGGGGRDQRKS